MSRKSQWYLASALLIPVFLIGSVIFLNRARATDPFDPPDFTPTPAPTDWLKPGEGEISYQAVEPVNLNKVPIRKIMLPKTQTREFIRPTSDGGCLAVTFELVDEQDTSGQPDHFLRVMRIKSDGGILWDNRYEGTPFAGTGVSMTVFPDDRFAIGMRVRQSGASNPRLVDRLVRFRADGTMKSETVPSEWSAGSLDHLFARPDGTILAVGTVDGSGWVGSSPYPRVTASVIEEDGTVSRTYIVSGVGYQSLVDVLYVEDDRLYLLSRIEDLGGEGQTGIAWSQRSQITCLTADIEERWSTRLESGQTAYSLLAQRPDGSLVISAALPEQESQPTAFRPALMAFNRDGAHSWSWYETPPAWFLAAAILEDGRLTVGLMQTGTQSATETRLLLFAMDSPSPQTLATIPGQLMELVPTQDGGLTVIARQSVRQLPQPPYISSIWLDTAVVVAHYDQALRLVWRRTIDQYKHDRKTDLVIVTSEDRLLAG